VDTLLAAWPWTTLAAALAIGALGGVVRGVTGFGAAMVMGPPLALLVGPAVTVPLVLLLEGFAASPMLRQAARRAHWPVLGPIVAAAALFVPVGTLLLSTLDPEVTRRAIAAIVLGFSLVLLTGLRWRGRYHPAAGFGLGALSGTMCGATGIGGPPVILYLLSGPDDAVTTRATLMVYIAALSVLGFGTMALRGLVGMPSLMLGLMMTPLFLAGLFAGARLFHGMSEQRFRRVTILMLLAVSSYVLLA
jgi:hypothetical protein